MPLLAVELILDPLSLNLAIPSSGAQAVITRKEFVLVGRLGLLLDTLSTRESFSRC